jgi:hypothetical protein
MFVRQSERLEKFEDTTGVIKIRKSKKDKTLAKRKKTTGLTMIPHRLRSQITINTDNRNLFH